MGPEVKGQLMDSLMGGKTFQFVLEEPKGKEQYMVEKEQVILTTIMPVYPPWRSGLSLRGSAGENPGGMDGRPVKAIALKNTHEIFEQAALDAARGFLFTPGYMTSGPAAV